jgi:AcrR family transcriptional regulator
MVELVAERGYDGVTVRSLTRLAGVSTRSFYKHFAHAEECFASTYESLMHAALRRARAAQRRVGGWEAGLRAALRSVLEDIASHPKQARLVLLEAYALGPPMHPHMNVAIGGFEQLLIDSFASAPVEVAAPTHIARGIAAGVIRVARTGLLSRDRTEYAGTERELGDWMLNLCTKLMPRPEPPTGHLRTSDPFNGIREGPLAASGSFGDHRGRILAAAAKLALTHGYASLTIPRIRAEAGVSRRRFDAHFADVEDCFLQAIEALATSAAARADCQGIGTAARQSQIEVAIGVLCAEAARNPALAQLVFVEQLAPGQNGLRRQDRLISLAARKLCATQPGQRLTGPSVEASVAAAWRLVQAEVEAGRARNLSSFAPMLTCLALTPHIAATAAVEAPSQAL